MTILEPIGAGGMGEVYKAKDTRLGRTVAIKVLPEHLAASAERKQRFEREAKVISQLNHPHICTLFDIGRQNGVDFLVLEHIEGDTLAERLKRGPLPLGDALRYGIGKTLVFHDFASTDNRDIKVFTPSESPDPTPLLVTEFNERSVSLSPDGRWLAYVSNESGSDEVYMRAYPYMNRKRSVSTNGGIQPVGSPTGRELF